MRGLIEQRQGEYDDARASLMARIEHPDKSVPVAEYRAQLTAAQKAVNRARKALQAAEAY